MTTSVAARWLVGSWHHHRFKGKVEIVGYCLENKSENQVWSCLWLLPSHAWAWQAAPGRGQAAPGRGRLRLGVGTRI